MARKLQSLPIFNQLWLNYSSSPFESMALSVSRREDTAGKSWLWLGTVRRFRSRMSVILLRKLMIMCIHIKG